MPERKQSANCGLIFAGRLARQGTSGEEWHKFANLIACFTSVGTWQLFLERRPSSQGRTVSCRRQLPASNVLVATIWGLGSKRHKITQPITTVGSYRNPSR